MRHGTITGYANGCRCDACVPVGRAYSRRWMQEYRRTGQTRTTDAAETREHILHLVGCGQSPAMIGALSGVSDQTVCNIRRGRTKRIRHETADRILSISTSAVADGNHLVPADGARTLIRAMRGSGVKAGQIVAWLGYDSSSSSVPTARNPRITYRNHLRIVTLYRLLARQGLVPADMLEEVGA